jgi:protein-tyrosine phosphatase
MFVFTGNICRSPLAEALWRQRFGERGLRFRSAGTHALVNAPMPPQAQAIARAWGVGGETAAKHRARQLDSALLHDTDLVIALTREHRAVSVRMAPPTNHRALTLREASRLMESLLDATDVDVARLRGLPSTNGLRELVALALAERSVSPVPNSAEDDDVVDPYRRNDITYALSAHQIVDATDRITAALSRLAQRP